MKGGRTTTTLSAGQVFMHSILRHIATVGVGGRTWWRGVSVLGLKTRH